MYVKSKVKVWAARLRYSSSSDRDVIACIDPRAEDMLNSLRIAAIESTRKEKM